MTQLLYVVFRRKEKLINKLLDLGIYKKNDQHLYELTLSEIEAEFDHVIKSKQSIG
ncbi:Fur-regulated basic protein FbpA [Bacillus sp. SA1-12]|uniref:Fur-regulated basic protein FbpA n=1 Tax=Bacillus sp. SA1-12 TaxID=1455638 RepID=UPI000A07CF61|nr:Fur-regulated basic protein FbpA [Bacillus sp. SA1-12]